MRLELISKHSVQQISKHVSASELHCRCTLLDCEHTLYSPKLLEKFELLRRECGDKPLIITSAFRCPEHNRRVNGRKTSRHMRGQAVDICPPDGMDILEFAKYCWNLFEFVKIYTGGNFCHCHLLMEGEK